MTINDSVVQVAMPEARTAPRTPVSIEAVIVVKESITESWKEVTTITGVSKNGAGLTLSKPCAVGRLVSLVSATPTELRCYDHVTPLYATMGIVQHCYAAYEGDETVYHIGIGFIGKQMPESYKQDPCTNYRISGMHKSGMWMVTPTDAAFKQRKEPRYWLSVPVTLTYTRKEDRAIFRDSTVTLNLAAGGASVATHLDVPVGEKIKFAYKEGNFYTIAEVKGRRFKKGEVACLHLEFLENKLKLSPVVNAALPQPPQVLTASDTQSKVAQVS